MSDHKSDQMSTPIELNDIPADIADNNDIAAIDDTDIRDTISDTNDNFQAEHELDNNYDEDNISFVNHSLSQQPLLNMTTFSNSMV